MLSSAATVGCAVLVASCGGGDDQPVSSVSVRSSASSIDDTVFPSNLFSVADAGQTTRMRVALPTPNCAVQISDCEDIQLINLLDGFSTQPRITIPFTGDIDPATVSSDSIFLHSLGDARTGAGRGERAGINQIVWDPASKSLFVESDQLLAEHTRYLVVVTDRVRDSQGRQIGKGGWLEPSTNLPVGTSGDTAYRNSVRDALASLTGSFNPVALSVFTTRSASSELVKIRQAVQAAPAPAPIDFMIAERAGAQVRAVFERSAVTAMRGLRQTATAPAFATSSLSLALLDARGPVVGQIAYGRYNSPNYLSTSYHIPATPTADGTPLQRGTHAVVVQAFLPAGVKPAGGWPVMVFGHGWGNSMLGSSWNMASSMAAKGIATVAINVVGHGGGPLSNVEADLTGLATTVVPSGGRNIDVNGNGQFETTEGAGALPPFEAMVGNRDAQRQTVIDLMQLVRQIQTGVDVDGDGAADLDSARIYYSGQSFGGMYGTVLTAVEPAIKASVLNVAGGSIQETTRLGSFRANPAGLFAARKPSIINLPAASDGSLQFDENIPLRNLPVRVNTVVGATTLARVIDRAEWMQQSVNPVSYAPLLRKKPLDGTPVRPVLFQNAKGDKAAPNPTSTSIIRAGDLADRAMFYRHDLVYAADPTVPKDPHGFLMSITTPNMMNYARAAQDQIATFFESNGATVIDPDGAGRIFEMPITQPLPETLNYID